MATNPQKSATDVARVIGLQGRRRTTLVVWAVALLAILGAAFGIRQLLRKRAESLAPAFRTQAAERRDITLTVSSTGRLQGLNTVEVGAEVTGKVLKVLADFNDPVARGQVLAELDPEQLLAQVQESRAQLLASEANIKTAQSTVTETAQARARADEQAALGLISRRDQEAAVAAAARAEASLASARASAELARAALRAAETRLGRTTIVAPIDGVVLSRTVEPGQTVTAGFQTPVLFKLAEDLTKLALHIDVDEADVARVKEGMDASFTVDAYPGRTFPSRVVSLRNEPKTSQNVVTYEAVLAVDNADRALRPGMTATATITSDVLPDVLVVPNAALRFTPATAPARGGGFGGPPRVRTAPDERRVFVLKDGVPVPVPVRPGRSDGRMTEIAEGAIEAGTEVVVDVLSRR